MIDPVDPHTTPLPLDGNDQAAPVVSSIVQARKDARLQDEFDLVRLRGHVYVEDKKAAQARSAGAERVAKHREKLAAEGFKPTAVPAALLDAVKAAGGWPEWQAKITAIEKIVEVPGPERIVRVEVPGPERVINVEVERRVEVQVPVPAKLGVSDTESLSLGRKVQALTGWKAALISWLLKP